MIRVRRCPTPASLHGPDSKGQMERGDAILHHQDPATREESFPFKAYKEQDVKDALESIFHGKCAYCESFYAVTQPVDVEHYRPKGAVVVDGRVRKPGYYWLAADWDNLLPSCIDCNRRRTQTDDDGEVDKSGKANFFPLRNEDRRATAPGEEGREDRLLLHPCRDFPSRHLEFGLEGTVRACRSPSGRVSAKGRASIEVLGLQRIHLVQARGDVAVGIQTQIRRVRRALRRQADNPSAGNLEELLEEIRELRKYTRPDRPYAGMARQLINPFMESVLGATRG